MKISKNNYYCITLIIFIAVIILVILYSDNIINVVNENFDILIIYLVSVFFRKIS